MLTTVAVARKPSFGSRFTGLTAILGRSGTVALIFLAFLAVVAVLAPWITPHDPTLPDPMNAYAPPSAAHLLGTDAVGRDLLSRLMAGTGRTLIAPIAVIALSTIFGTVIAIASAWAGGAVDSAVSRMLDVLFAVPGIVFALVAVSIVGPGQKGVVVGLIIAYTPYTARLVRGAALREMKLPYVSAAWVQGRSGSAICTRHLLPNLRGLIGTQAISALGFAVLDISAISFLGLGAQPPESDWGQTVQAGLDSILRGHSMEALSAGILIALVVASVTVIGDRLTKAGDHQ